MIRKIMLVPIAAIFILPVLAQTPAADHGWIAVSNSYTDKLVTIEMNHNPESGSRQGLSEYDATNAAPCSAYRLFFSLHGK